MKLPPCIIKGLCPASGIIAGALLAHGENLGAAGWLILLWVLLGDLAAHDDNPSP